MKNNWPYISACFVILYFASASGYTADLNLERPTVTKAFDVVDRYPESIPQGTLVTFKRKDTKLAAHIIDEGLQARVFSLGDQEKIPQPIDTTGNCDHYISTVIPLTKNGNDIVFSRVGEDWLYPTASGNSIKDGRYYFVFEKVGSTQEHFRLRTSDALAYFESGFLLIVKDNGAASLERVKKEYKQRKSKLDSLILEIDDPAKKVPCYKYVRLAESSELQEYPEESLSLCEMEKTVDSKDLMFSSRAINVVTAFR